MADLYYERTFQAKMREAMKKVKLILHAEKKPVAAADCHHQYQDKYLLAECMVSAAVASQLNCLTFLGVSQEQLTQLKAWSAVGTAVSLRLEAEEICVFDREETREVEGPKCVEEASVGGGVVSALTSKVVTKVTEYFWKFTVKYELNAFRGVGADGADRIRILGRTGTHELKTSSKSTPRPASKIPAIRSDVNVSWLFQKLSDEHMPAFAIRREHAECHTPRRNIDVASALEHFVEFRLWCQQLQRYMDNIFNVNLELRNIAGPDALFVPVLPLLEEREGRAVADAADAAAAPSTALATLSDMLPADSTVLAVGNVNLFLAEEQRQLEERRRQLQTALPNSDLIATAQEAAIRLTASHCQDVCLQLAQALDYIEQMLRAQLQAAIGKEVTPADFAEYMCFHSRKLFAAEFLPIPFCFSVRRTNNHSPEGTLSIEQPGGSGALEPIVTLVGKSSTPEPMSFPLNASAKVTFGGDRYLHAWLQHSFQGVSGPPLSLVARARQFSSFIVLAGRVTSKTTFEPKCAAIVENRDELTIPLEASTIPTPKEFKDAIASLSTEMQEFAKAFRSMQLESTLFSVVIIQIKPQLEKVLNLPEDSLTKEIKLTQQLMRLFIEYQIPSDLLSFDGDSEGFEVAGMASATERLTAVREHVEAIYKMIDEAKTEELNDRIQETDFADPWGAPGGKGGGDWGGAGGGMMMRSAAPPMMRSNRSRACAAPVAASRALPCMAAAAAPPPLSVPSAPTPLPQPAQLQQPQQDSLPGGRAAMDVDHGSQRDYTDVPKELDSRFEKLDADNALRPTIIKPGDVWTKREKKKLLADFSSRSLRGDDQQKEKNAAFDLLDALTKSGGMAVDHASLHVLVAATHSFDKSVMETVVQDNVNPIEKVERSMLIMGSTVHQRPVAELLQGGQQPRVEAACPKLFLADA